jgi:hypothetical protein
MMSVVAAQGQFLRQGNAGLLRKLVKHAQFGA